MENLEREQINLRTIHLAIWHTDSEFLLARRKRNTESHDYALVSFFQIHLCILTASALLIYTHITTKKVFITSQQS